jgi:hypothetical protein
MPVNTLIQLRRGTEGDWSSAPQTIGRGVLYEGEIGVVTTSGDIKLKVGDGTTPWGELCYAGVPLNSGNYIAGSGITIEYDNLCASGLWKINENWLNNFIANSSGAINVEGVQDIIGNSGIVGGFGINKSYDDGTGFTTVSVTGMTLSVAESTGIGVSSTTESDNSVYTISVTGIDHTLITDWDAAISGDIDTQLIAGTGISFAYDSGNNTLTISTAVLDDTHTHIWDNITDAKVKASLTELGYLSGVAPGTASADRVVVLDSNKDVTGIRNLTSTSTITAVTFSGDLTGNADTATEATNVTVVDNSNENASLYITFVDGVSGTQEIETDSALTYNPSTNTLFPGNVSATGTVAANHVQTATLITTGNVTVGGDLTVAGTTTTVNSTVVEIGDNIIRVNTSGLATGGLEVRNSGTSDYKQFVWDNADTRWEVGNENLQANRFVSTESSPTAPLVVASTGLVTNLNSDLLDGQHGSYYLDWGHFSNLPTPNVTVAVTGDVSGTTTVSNWNLSDNLSVSINTTIQADSVALGTDTTGNYVAAVGVSGSGLTLGGSAGEGATFTVQSNATPANTADTIVSRDTSGNFSAGTITAALSGNASTATKLATARYIELTGDVTGSGLFDGSTNIQISTTVEGAGTVTLADESLDQDNYITFANDATGDEALKTNTSLRFNALNKILLGSAVGASGTPATRLEYFIVDGGTP